jgi:DNA-binding NtrC family response regulator
MPGDMNGIDLAYSVRNRFPGVPVILISGFLGEGATEKAGFELLRKPFVPETILDAVRRVMQALDGG